LEHVAIGGDFLVEGQWVGTRGRGEAVELHREAIRIMGVGNDYGTVDAGHRGNGKDVADGGGGFLAGGDDKAAVGQLVQQGADIGRFYNLEELVGGIVLQTSHSCGGVEEGQSLLLTEGNDVVDEKPLVDGIDEMVLVAEMDLTLDAPVVVDEVGVKEVHGPPLALWGKTAQEKHTGMGRQKGTQWMVLDVASAAGYVLGVQIGCHSVLLVWGVKVRKKSLITMRLSGIFVYLDFANDYGRCRKAAT